ncbi:MAG TPA: SEC-C domain-containing protein [Bryobacteraceae bacterium]|jgi:hypothetical protein
MSTTATATALQLEANRANSLLSTGPTTSEGKLASSRNAQSHGLTTRDALLPGEDLAEYQQHHAAYIDHFRPSGPIDIEAATEIADLRWRLRRVPAYEAQLISMEVHRLKTDPELKPLTQVLDSDSQFIALAFRRLVETRTLTNLLNLESRLARRIDKLQTWLELSKRTRLDQESKARIRAAAAAVRARMEQTVEEPIEPGNEEIETVEEIGNAQNEANSDPAAEEPSVANRKVGRNERCPCGSGLKFKRCCLQQKKGPSLCVSMAAGSR